MFLLDGEIVKDFSSDDGKKKKNYEILNIF